MLERVIPSSGEMLPLLGLGTWQRFDVSDKSAYPALSAVLSTLHGKGACLIDSSPMYGTAEEVVGDLTAAMPQLNGFFYATKVWTTGRSEGIAQMERSMRKMKRQQMDLMQIHNLTDWQTHLPVLREWRESGRIRYIGITHYTDSMHEALEQVLVKEKDIDFVQFNYAIDAVHAEKRLLNVAGDLGIATLINRPFGEGKLFHKTGDKPLPAWAAELGIHSWSSFCLKYIISHPAVTCVIPATASSAHAAENAEACEGYLPDAATRAKMKAFFDSL